MNDSNITGRQERAQKRTQRRMEEARRIAESFFSSIEENGVSIAGVVQVGIGPWWEGEELLRFFPSAHYLGIEPLQRYIYNAWNLGFRGPIIEGAVCGETGNELIMYDRRDRTSVHFEDDQSRLPQVRTTTITLDDAVKYVRFPDVPTLLWMDCEGGELQALDGANNFIDQVVAIVAELKDAPKLQTWPNADEVISRLDGLGFYLHSRIGDGLFLRKQNED